MFIELYLVISTLVISFCLFEKLKYLKENHIKHVWS